MKTTSIHFIGIVIISLYSFSVFSCTNLIVTKGASKDGSVMVVYTCDGEFHPHPRVIPAADHKRGEFIEIKRWDKDMVGKIKQVPHTYGVVGPYINEFQVAIGETTFGGREELVNSEAFLHYWHMMWITLQRSKTAREAVEVLTGLAEEYDYGSEGETFAIGDKNEAWIVEMTGTGPGGKGAVWVAMKIPDGYVCAHANKARIGEFPMDDPENCIYSKNVISFAIEKGYYDPVSGEPFRFNEVYDPSCPSNLRYCSTRIWSLFRRCAPSLNLSPDYHRGVKGAERYPLWIKPDSKLSLKDVIDLVRDHYEGTDIDMTKGMEAGPFGCPNRWRPLTFQADSAECSWERPVSTYNTGFSFISQSRSWLPDEVGGVLWYGFDDTYFTCYAPFYCCITGFPEIYTTGTIRKFSWESAWWVFNFVSNYANLKYSYMIKDVQKLQNEIELKFIIEQDSIDKEALKYAVSYKPPVTREGSDEKYTPPPSGKEEIAKVLTEYCVKSGEMVVKRWIELGELLITKYNDGYVKDENGRPRGVGYPDEWYKKTMKDREGVKLPVWDDGAKTAEPTNF